MPCFDYPVKWDGQNVKNYEIYEIKKHLDAFIKQSQI